MTTVCSHRRPLFLDFACARDVIAEMRRLHDLNHVRSLAFVVMPDHLHWLFELGSPLALEQVLQEFKGRSAHRVNRRLGQSGALWQKTYFDHALRGDEDLRAQARYIVVNPLRAGLVEDIGAYPHWDALWLDATLSG